MTHSSTRIMLLVVLLFSFASFLYAGPVDCAVTPGDPACVPAFSITYQVADGPQQTVSPTTPVYQDGAWIVSFTPQQGQFIFKGGRLVTTPDPFVGFSFGVINNSNAVMTFNYDFSTPYSGGPYPLLQSVFGDGLIDTNFFGTSTVAPSGSSYIMNTYDTGNLLTQVGLGKGCTTPLNVYFCVSPDDGAIGPLLYTSFANGTLEVKGSFTVTPGGQYVLTGRSQIYTPEPGTLALLGTGIVGLGGWLRRRL